MKKNIVLIGMPACGKSVTGVLLAKILRKKFIDGDLVIQETTGKTLQQIIDEMGNDTFKEIERQVLCGLKAKNAVIATGGSAVYYPDAMSELGREGIIVYIKISIDQVKVRLNNITTRGVAMAPGQTLDSLYEERSELYEKYADVVVSANPGKSIEETVSKIVEAVK